MRDRELAQTDKYVHIKQNAKYPAFNASASDVGIDAPAPMVKLPYQIIFCEKYYLTDNRTKSGARK